MEERHPRFQRRGLRDQRDASLDRLSELIDIRYFTRGDGDVVVFTSAMTAFSASFL